MAKQDNSMSLSQFLTKHIPELVPCIEEAQRAAWEPGYMDVDGLRVIGLDFYVLAHQIVNVGDSFSVNKMTLIKDVRELFRLNGDKNPFVTPRQLREIYQMNIRRDSSICKQRIPSAVRYLWSYDIEHSTDYATRAKAIFYYSAEAIIYADGTVTKYEEAFLDDYKSLLHLWHILPR